MASQAHIAPETKAPTAPRRKGGTPRNYPSTRVRDAHLQRYFGQLPVVEATTELHLQPQDCDIETAKRDDPTSCAFSRACQRMYGSTVVLFFRTTAYVDLLGEDGRRKIHRFKMGSAARKFIEALDAGEMVAPAGFRLSPPAPAETLDGLDQQRKRREAKQREALLKGETHVPDPRFRHSGMNRPTAARFRNFRSGAGMVHFPPAIPA